MFIKVLAIKTRELNSVQSDCSARSCQMENKHAQELTAEREKALQVIDLIIKMVSQSLFTNCAFIFIGFLWFLLPQDGHWEPAEVWERKARDWTKSPHTGNETLHVKLD